MSNSWFRLPAPPPYRKNETHGYATEAIERSAATKSTNLSRCLQTLQTGWDHSQPRSRILNDYSYTPESSLESPLSCRRRTISSGCANPFCHLRPNTGFYPVLDVLSPAHDERRPGLADADDLLNLRCRVSLFERLRNALI